MFVINVQNNKYYIYKLNTLWLFNRHVCMSLEETIFIPHKIHEFMSIFYLCIGDFDLGLLIKHTVKVVLSTFQVVI